MSKKVRLDVLLVERGLLDSRQKAQANIMAGLVFVNGQRVDTDTAASPQSSRSWRRTHLWRCAATRCPTSAAAD